MRCQRCHGLMVVDHFVDMKDGGGQLWLRAWRCANCGEVVEPGIVTRRSVHRSLFPRAVERFIKKPTPVHDVVPLGI